MSGMSQGLRKNLFSGSIYQQRLSKPPLVLEHGYVITSMCKITQPRLILCGILVKCWTQVEISELMSNYTPHKTVGVITYPLINLS